MWDVFISYASEDKDPFVSRLASELKAAGLSVWFDEFELRPGSKLLDCIDQGLRQSHYGVIVLSESFFKKNWPKRELDSLVTKELSTGDSVPRIIPVWLDIDASTVSSYSFDLVNRRGISCTPSAESADYAAFEILRAVRPELVDSNVRIAAWRKLKAEQPHRFRSDEIPLSNVLPGEKRHDALPRHLFPVSMLICEVFGDVLGFDPDVFNAWFTHDLDYDAEVAVWTAITSAYLRFLRLHPEFVNDLEFKQSLLAQLLVISTGSTQLVLDGSFYDELKGLYISALNTYRKGC